MAVTLSFWGNHRADTIGGRAASINPVLQCHLKISAVFLQPPKTSMQVSSFSSYIIANCQTMEMKIEIQIKVELGNQQPANPWNMLLTTNENTKTDKSTTCQPASKDSTDMTS